MSEKIIQIGNQMGKTAASIEALQIAGEAASDKGLKTILIVDDSMATRISPAVMDVLKQQFEVVVGMNPKLDVDDFFGRLPGGFGGGEDTVIFGSGPGGRLMREMFEETYYAQLEYAEAQKSEFEKRQEWLNSIRKQHQRRSKK